MGTYSGSEANRTGGPLPNMGGRLTDGRPIEQQPTKAPSAPAAQGEKPTVAAPASPDPLVDLDPEDVAGWRRQLQNGIRTPQELQRAYGLSEEELAAVQSGPKPGSRTKAESRLAELKELRRTDPKR